MKVRFQIGTGAVFKKIDRDFAVAIFDGGDQRGHLDFRVLIVGIHTAGDMEFDEFEVAFVGGPVKFFPITRGHGLRTSSPGAGA